jgi:hypothetical protein
MSTVGVRFGGRGPTAEPISFPRELQEVRRVG